MEKSEKKSLASRIQDYLDTPKGRILLNYLYSWGAAIVILGALFKLTHIKGANLMLFIGMGTEVLVFFISGFERPYIPNSAEDEEVPVRQNIADNVRQASANTGTPVSGTDIEEFQSQISALSASMRSMCSHAERMQQSSEELETLTRNLISINTFYEMHLKSASRQMEDLENASLQTRTMVEQIEELNRVYARMIEAMKVNSQIGNK
mgnify:CR=1 FL=1